MSKLTRVSVLFYALPLAALSACSAPSMTSAPTVPGASLSRSATAAYGAALQAALHPASMRGTVGAQSHAAGWLSPLAKHAKNLIYSGNFDTGTITIFPAMGKNRKPIGQITDGVSEPERLFVDAARNLYASEAGNSTVTEYAPGTTTPSRTISTGVSSPTGLTVDADGTVYVANTGNDTVTAYTAGSDSPSLTITFPTETPENMAVDSKNNLYVQYLGGTAGSGVMEFAPGATTGTDLGLNVTSASAVEVDRKGNVIVLDAGTSPSQIDVFPPGKTQPSKTIPVSAGFPFELSLNKKETELYVSVDLGIPFIVQVVAYPNGTAPTTKIDNSNSGWPLAVSPDAVL